MLFGNILGVTDGDLHLIMLISAVSLIALFLFYKELKLFSVDPNYAKTIGMPVKAMHYGILLFLSFTVVVGIQAVGTVLTNALLVIPVAAARMLTDRLGRMMALVLYFCGNIFGRGDISFVLFWLSIRRFDCDVCRLDLCHCLDL